jgi:phospholipid/cholesterol/gamma-HCH transport system permease protein
MPFVDVLATVGRYAEFAWRALPAALLAWRRPDECLRQLHNILLGALPLGLVAGVSLGVVVWLHMHGVVSPELRHKVPEFLALGVVLEFAPLGAGLIVAGRSGASLGAELGSMRITEQLDALEALGQSPRQQLVGPRVLAAMLTLPLLTIYMGAFALGSSMGAELLGGTLSLTQYQNDLLRGLARAHVVLATLKTVVFGYLIGVTGCYFGMQASGGTEGVGHAATQGVVYSILLVLLSNVVLVKVIQLVT